MWFRSIVGTENNIPRFERIEVNEHEKKYISQRKNGKSAVK